MHEISVLKLQKYPLRLNYMGNFIINFVGEDLMLFFINFGTKQRHLIGLTR